MGTIKNFFKTIFKEGGVEHYTPSPIANPSREVNYDRFSDLLPYLAWIPERRLFVLEGDVPQKVDAIGFCLEMTPQTGATPDMADLLTTIFTYLPKGSGVQWSLIATPLIDRFLDAYVGVRLDPATAPTKEERERRELFRALAQRQAEHFRKGATDPLVPNQPYLLRDFRIVMSVVIPATSYEDEDLLHEIETIRETCATTLKTYYQYERDWDPEDLINWCAVVLNPQEAILKRNAPHINYDEGRPIKEQIIAPNTVMRVTEDGLIYGLPQRKNECIAKCMSVRSYPKACTLNAMGSLIGDYMQPAIGYTSPFMITIGISTLDFEESRATTQMKAARATQKAESPMARFLPELQDIKYDWDIAQRSFDEGKGTVHMYHQLILWAAPEDMARAEQSAQAVWRSRQFEIVEDTFIQIQGLLGSLPMSLTPTLTKDIRTAQRMTTKTIPNAVNMAPLLAEWHGVGRPIVPMWGRRGQAMSIDLFANMTGNFNAVIAGTSGSGKSVLLNSIALSYLGIGGRVWIVDIGRSFEKLCHTVGGQYLEFTPESDIRLNPFTMVEDIEDDLEMLVPLFEQMVSPSEPLDDYRRRQLGLHILSVWYEKGREATVDDLAYSLINNCEKGGPNSKWADPEWIAKVRALPHEERQNLCDPRIRDIGIQLFPYTSDGPYGRYFHGETNVNFESDLIVLELEELAAKKDLQAVIMFLLMYRITQNMYLTRNRPKICILDEAWSLLGSGNSGDFIETGYRRARKYHGSFCAATQGIGDFSMSRAAEAAFNNADWLFLLRQKPESILALEKSDKLVIDEGMRDMLMSVKTVQGVYSEVFVHGGQMGHGIGRVLFDPFSLLLVSSKAEDFEAVKAYRQQGYTIVEALESVLADRGMPGYTHKLQRKAA
ncbi:type IV secretion system protein TraC [Sulfuricystis multivorans]|uniref:type IV secretion system protein TraC n=1 Tax=Sulfuricystis multivorans TaxID=2211108 RepID=UPI000F82E83D|nr:type IV secretion system protein TraC [Sulfuricystis multivorans]